jgi:parvulin-like peptidyl-prolyl isomerase
MKISKSRFKIQRLSSRFRLPAGRVRDYPARARKILLAIYKKSRRQKELISHPWFTVALLLTIYLLGLIGMTVVVYGYKVNSPATRAFLKVFPLPAVIFDSQTIPAGQVFERMQYSINFNLANKREQEPEGELRDRVIGQLIEDYLYRLGSVQAGVVVTSQEVEDTFAKIAEENGGVEEVANALDSLYGMSIKDFKKLIKIQLLKDKVRDEAFEQVRVKHILVESEEVAKQVAEKIHGVPFEEVAKEYSKDENSREQGGDIGWVRRGQYDEKLEEAIFQMEAGETRYEPIQSNYGWHVVKVEEKKGVLKGSLEAWLEDLREKTRIWRLLK